MSELGHWPISVEIAVQWGEMDALNHVNNTVFLRWMETARMNYFIGCGFAELYESEGIGPILANINVDYIKPVEFPDTVTIHNTITRIGNASFEMGYRITSSAMDGATVATGTASCVVFDYKEGKSTPLPDTLRASILEFEDSGNA